MDSYKAFEAILLVGGLIGFCLLFTYPVHGASLLVMALLGGIRLSKERK